MKLPLLIIFFGLRALNTIHLPDNIKTNELTIESIDHDYTTEQEDKPPL